jgi:predicted LPLAT superfamily acyltransferase
MLALMRLFPRRLCLALCGPASLLFYMAAQAQRTAILHNLRALSPKLDAWSLWWRGWQVFYHFALVYLDRLYHMHFSQEVTWDLPGLALLEQLKAETCGVLIFTAHSGNYDIGASLFAAKINRPVHIVRVPEPSAELQSIRAAELHQDSHLHVHYNTQSDSHLGLQLCRLIQDGQFVAVQGDRVVMDVSPYPRERSGIVFHLPRGPLILAEVTRCPCYPIFLTRSGFMRYRIHVAPPFVVGGEPLQTHQVADRWLDHLLPFISSHFEQWFVFEPLIHTL